MRLNGILRALALRSQDGNSGKTTALAQVDKLYQLVAKLRERLESEHCLVHPETIAQLDEAQANLAAALKSMHS